MFVGTGESQTALVTYRESSGKGLGIWKSTDGGQSFSLLPSTKDFAYISSLLCRQEGNTSVLYAGVLSGVYQGQTNQSQPSDGLYRSADQGQTWTQVLPGIPGDGETFAPSDIEETADGTLLVGTTFNLQGEGGACILRSSTGLAGSWTINTSFQSKITHTAPYGYNLPGRVILAPAPSDASIVYALIAAGFQANDDHPFYRVPLMLRSSDGGQTWTEKSIPSNDPRWASIAWHALAIAVNPVNPNIVLIGGLDIHRSMDGGNTWIKMTDWAGMYNPGQADYVHADQHVMTYLPGSARDIIFSNDGVSYYARNITSENPVYADRNKAYTTLQYYTTAIHPDPNHLRLLGGLQDNGTHYTDAQSPMTISTLVSGGDGAYCFFDELDPSIWITSVYYNLYYQFQNDLFQGFVQGNNGMFINPADYHAPSQTIYANAASFFGQDSDQLYLVLDVVNQLDTVMPANTGTIHPFSSVKVSPYGSQTSPTVFLGTTQGELYKVNNVSSKAVATPIGSASFPKAWISSISLGKTEDTLLVTFSNYGVPSLWYTTNGGQQWQNIEGDLPDLPVRWAILHPDNSTQVMLATEMGIWTNDHVLQSSSWTLDPTFPYVRIDMLSVRKADGMVLAGTHGRGLFYGEWAPAVPLVSTDPAQVNSASFGVAIDPATHRMRLTDLPVGRSHIRLLNLTGQTVYQARSQQSYHDLSTLNLTKGVYVVEIQTHGTKQQKKVLLR